MTTKVTLADAKEMMERTEGKGVRTIIEAAGHRARRRLSVFYGGSTQGRNKPRAAAKFFIRLLNGMTSSAIDECVAKMWTDYRRWNDICSLTKLDPRSTDLSVLDIGGGLTTVTRMFDTPRRWVLDICVDEMRKGGITLPPGIHFINGEAERIPFPDGFFRHVFSSNALDHFKDPRAALREMRRVMSDDGYCVIAVDIFPTSRLGEHRGIKHPHTFSEKIARDLVSSTFEVMDVLRQPEGGKVGFQQLVRGDVVPQTEKEELIYVLRK